MSFTIAPFYNVQETVGRGGTNYTTDVMLVQYMIFHVCIQPIPHFARNIGLFGPTAPGIGPAAIFPTNGIYVPELDDWILNFQQAANERGYGPLTTDGKVNRAPVGWGKKAHSAGHWYTIQALNLLMFQKCEEPYSTLPDLSDVPGQMAKELKLVVLEEWVSS